MSWRQISSDRRDLVTQSKGMDSKQNKDFLAFSKEEKAEADANSTE